MGKRRNQKGRITPLSSEADFFEGKAGPPIYTYPMPPIKSRGRLLAGGIIEVVPVSPEEANATATVPQASPALVPSSEEVAKLPRNAREAFAARCAERVAPLRANATTPEAAAALILAAATVETPIRRLLLRIRRDFDTIAALACQEQWQDDTPVPADVFGALWPTRLTPPWAASAVTEAPRSQTNSPSTPNS